MHLVNNTQSPSRNAFSTSAQSTINMPAFSLSILKRQLERGRDVMLRCQMSHVYTIIFLIILIF